MNDPGNNLSDDLTELEIQHLTDVFNQLFSDENAKTLIDLFRETKSRNEVFEAVSLTEGDNHTINLVLGLYKLADRDVALVWSIISKLEPMVNADRLAAALGHKIDKDQFELQSLLLASQPTAVLCALILSGVIKPDSDIKKDVVAVLKIAMDRDFNIGIWSVRTILSDPSVMERVGTEHQERVCTFIATLQQLQAVVSVPEDIQALIDASFTSAHSIAQASETNFVATMVSRGVQRERAIRIHNHATVVNIRSDNIWASAQAARKELSLAAVSLRQPDIKVEPATEPPAVAEINLTNMFDMESMECEDCASVTAAPAYFVDLLETLKRVKLGENTPQTLLDNLLKRRPDLGNLKLSCANTKVSIPYIDLVNEVLESVVWHISGSTTQKDIIPAFDMGESDTSQACSAQPRNVNFQVYQKVVQPMVYPLTVLPYNQAIDSIRSFLEALGGSRHRLLRALRSTYRLTTANGGGLLSEAELILDHAAAAEYLDLFHEDYVAITKEGFYSFNFLKSVQPALSQSDYGQKIGRKSAAEYWGYSKEQDMSAGLTFIKDQFMQRGGITFQEVLDLLETRYVDKRLVIQPQEDDLLEFSGKVADMHLRQLRRNGTTGPLEQDICYQLQAFLRLRRKLGWSIVDTDAAIVMLAGDRTAGIDPQTIDGLAAVKQLASLTSLSISQLLPLWGDMDAHRETSLYFHLFPSHGGADVFTLNDVLGGGREFSDNLGVVLQALHLTADAFDAIKSAVGIGGQLTLSNISALYRTSLLCNILDISPLRFVEFLSLYPPRFDPLKDPRTTVEVVTSFRALKAGDWSLNSLLFVVKGSANPSSQYSASVRQELETTVTIVSALSAASKTKTGSEVAGHENAIADQVDQLSAQLFGAGAGHIVSQFVGGSHVNEPAKSIFQRLLLPVLGVEKTSTLITSLNVLEAEQSADIKRRNLFLKSTAPALQRKRAQQLILGSLKSYIPGLDIAALKFLLLDIIKVKIETSSGESIVNGMDCLSSLQGQAHNPEDSESSQFDGYLMPPVTDVYIFVVYSQPSSGKLQLDGTALGFDEESNSEQRWVAKKKLINGHTYRLWFDGKLDQLKYVTEKSPGSTPAALGRGILIDKWSVLNAGSVMANLSRAGIIIERYGLTVAEIEYWQNSKLAIDFNALTLANFQLLRQYKTLRNGFSRAGAARPLLDLYKWISLPIHIRQGSLAEQITLVSGWPKRLVLDILKAKYSGLAEDSSLLPIFQNVSALFEMQDAVNYIRSLGLRGVSVESLYEMAQSLAPPTASIDFRNAAILRHGLQSIPGASGSSPSSISTANDRLRSAQRTALVHCLLAQEYARTNGLMDADSLFGFFLIDVQRCILGAEKDHGVPSNVVDRRAWDNKLKYRVWEANKKAFLYPENWNDPTLRDDKTDEFKAFESRILQTKLDIESITDAVKSYIHATNDLADLQVESYLWEKLEGYHANFHFFARTRTSPVVYYYRKLEQRGVASNIIAYCDADGKKLRRPGSYLIPAVFCNRLFLFVPEIVLGTTPPPVVLPAGKPTEPTGNRGERHWEIKIGWMEYRKGKWSSKQVSHTALEVAQDSEGRLPDISSFKFWVRIRVETKHLVIDVERWVGKPTSRTTDIGGFAVQRLGQFEMKGQNLVLVDASGVPLHTTVANEGGADNSMHTLKTFFSKITWSLLNAEPFAPDDTAWYHGKHRRPLLATAPAVSEDGSKCTWTMSFDNINCDTPTGLVFEMANVNSIQSFFAFPPDGNEGREDHYYEFERFHNTTSPLFAQRMNVQDGLKSVYQYLSQLPQAQNHDAFGLRNSNIPHERSTPYAIYNWELGVHIPSLLMKRLLATQQFDLALEVARWVFDPTVNGDKIDRCWSFPPFRDERIRTGKGPDFALDWIKQMAADEWSATRSSVHAAARANPAVYMKRIAIKYIEILIAAGDHYFRQNSMESIPLAIQRYIEASHVFGPPPIEIPRLNSKASNSFKSYNEIAGDFDVFSKSVKIELDFPFYSNPNSRGLGSAATSLGFVQTNYFCVPANPYIVSVRKLIDDRLYNIRNSMDINGKERKLSLFEPPIDPGALVRANAGGFSSDMAGDFDSPMPKYRFSYLLNRALELCAELRNAGNQVLVAKEKRDAEALSMMRSRHQTSVLAIMMDVKQRQRQEALKAIEALQEARKQHETRLSFYLELIGEPAGRIPSSGKDWEDIQQTIEKPKVEGDLRMSWNEEEEMAKAEKAAAEHEQSGILEATASALAMIPSFSAVTQPFGIGVDLNFTGIGDVLKIAAGAMKTKGELSAFESAQAGRKAGLTRQLQDRRLQANMAGRDIIRVDKDIAVLRARVGVCDAEIRQQQCEMDNATEMEEWLRTKYTGEQLYAWFDNSLGTLFHQTYLLTNDFARLAQRALQFEHTLNNTRQLRQAGGYWDASRDGMLCAESLWLDLKRMEMAHLEARTHDFEIVKAISLRQIKPWALLQLRETGTADFELPEILFDMDFPGHYCRRIRSMAVSVSCIVGPYTSLNCTLSLRKHIYRVDGQAPAARDYPEKTDGDLRFRTDRIPITSIAVSTGMQDAGVFELDFRGDQYGPFEGAGAISDWRIELPSDIRQFDYNTISDVIIHLRYTAVAGGALLKKAATDSLMELVKSANKSGLAIAVDLKNDYAGEWHAFGAKLASGVKSASMTLKGLSDRMPFWTKYKTIKATSISVVLSPKEASEKLGAVSVTGAEKVDLEVNHDAASGNWLVSTKAGVAIPVTDWQLEVQNSGGAEVQIEWGWLVLEYATI